MRQLILDTETTGLDPSRAIASSRSPGRAGRPQADRPHVHFYVNPEREIDSGATDVHGMSWDDAAGQAEIRRRSPTNSSNSRAARSGSSTTRRSTSPSSTRNSPALGRSSQRRDCGGSRRHACARARAVSGQAQQPRRAVRAVRRRQRASHAAWRAARRAAAGRSVSRDDAGPGIADDRHHHPARGEVGDGAVGGKSAAAAHCWCRRRKSSPRIGPTWSSSIATRRGRACGWHRRRAGA